VDAIKHRRVAAGRQAWQRATGRVLEEVLENWPVFESGFGGAVQRPLMPKGVEHIRIPMTWDAYPDVQRPLMPKGVEHSLAWNLKFRRSWLCRDL